MLQEGNESYITSLSASYFLVSFGFSQIDPEQKSTSFPREETLDPFEIIPS